MIIIYRKSDLVCVGTVASGMTIEQEIELNAIPNFGGVAGDYASLETNEHSFHLEIINGVVTPVKNTVTPLITQPSETEILWQTVTDLQLELIMTNQFLTDAQLEIEILKGGMA